MPETFDLLKVQTRIGTIHLCYAPTWEFRIGETVEAEGKHNSFRGTIIDTMTCCSENDKAFEMIKDVVDIGMVLNKITPVVFVDG